MVAITVLLATTAATFFPGFEDRTTAEQPIVAVQGEFGVDGGGHELGIESVRDRTYGRSRASVRIVSESTSTPTGSESSSTSNVAVWWPPGWSVPTPT